MPNLIRPQAEFLALPHKFRAYVGGFGSGKTWAGCAGQCRMAWEHPGLVNGYFAPTYPQIRDVFYPTVEEVAADWGLRAEVKQANHEVLLFSGRTWRQTIICRSMDNPERIVGFKIARALVDELDTLPTEKAKRAWSKIIARLRLKFDGLNGVDVTTTPEGFKFTWQQWVRAPRENPSLQRLYGLVKASTRDNEAHLVTDYVESLQATYPANLVDAYIDGEFVNLTQGTVYVQFDRRLNASAETIKTGDVLHVGMDFNVGKMAAVIHVERGGNPHAVDEIMGGYDTPDMIRMIKERYWTHIDGDYRQTHQIRVYPDIDWARARRSQNANETDVQLLKQAGFVVSSPNSNPPVKDRVNTMNAMFCNAKGERRYFVNAERCPTYAEALEQQAYNARGEPDKAHDQDHPNDAAGYYIHRKFPLAKPVRNLRIGVAQ